MLQMDGAEIKQQPRFAESKRKSILLVLLCKTNDNKDQFKRIVIFSF